MSVEAKRTPPRLHRAHGQAALRKLVGATALSSLGDGLVVVAFPLLAVQLTSNALLIGGLATALGLPWLVIGIPAGVLADRVNRRRLVVGVELVRALLVGGVAIAVALGRVHLVELYAAAFLIGAGETVVSAAARSVVPRAARGDAVVTAQGRLHAARTGAVQFAGPASGGALFAAARSLPFLGDALSYVVSALLLRGALADVERLQPTAPTGRPRRATPRAGALRSTFGWFASDRPMVTLAATVGSFAFCQSMVLGVLVIYGTSVLHLGSTGYGVFLALGATGDLVGSFLAARVNALLRPYATVLVVGTLAAGGYLLLGSTRYRALAVVALLIEAAATSIGNVVITSARYQRIPSEQFGAVNNTFRSLVYGVAAAGSLAGGALAVALGTRHTFLVAGSLQLGALVLLAAPLRRLAATDAEATPEAAT